MFPCSMGLSAVHVQGGASWEAEPGRLFLHLYKSLGTRGDRAQCWVIVRSSSVPLPPHHPPGCSLACETAFSYSPLSCALTYEPQTPLFTFLQGLSAKRGTRRGFPM